MTSIVTASTLAALRSMTAEDFTSVMALVAVLTFLVLAIHKEVLGSSPDQPSRTLSRGLNIGLIPLAIVLLVIMFAQLYHVVR